MTDSSSKKANAFLQTENRDLKSVFGKIKQLEELNRNVAVHIDASMRDYCQVANVIGNRLILIAANGSISTQIRYQTADLVKKFALDPALQHIKEIHCKVRPATTALMPARHSYTKSKKMAPLSQATAEMVRGIAESLEDPKLKEVMERIASHTKDER